MPRQIPSRGTLHRSPGLLLIVALVLLLVSSTTIGAAEPAPGSSLDLMTVLALAVERDPSIGLAARQVETAQGNLLIAASDFDTTLSAGFGATDSTTPTSETTESESRSYSQSAGVTTRLRSGQTLEPEISLSQEDGDPGVSTGTFAFTVRQPLWRGRTRSVITTEERASALELEASRLDWLHRIAQRLLAVTNQYWSVRAAELDLQILRDTEARAKELLASTRRLVEADLTPAAELIQLEADVISREAGRIAGEQALFRARQNLRAEIGLRSGELGELGTTADPFPTADVAALPAERALLAEAMERRADLAADRERLAATEIRLERARDALKPRLDLLLTPSFTGLVEDDGFDGLSALGSNIPGLSASLSLSYTLPIGNRAAEGSLIRATAAAEQQALGVESLEIQIGAGVPSALDAVRRNAERLAKLEEAVRLFERTLANEQKKLRVGQSILIDVLNQRDRLTSVQRSLVSARLALAQALATLRFETGTLVGPSGVVPPDSPEVQTLNVTTVPLRGE